MTESDTVLWMRHLAALSREAGSLPDPLLIWWQARLREQQEARSRAARPLLVAQWASAVIAVAVVFLLCLAYWPSIRDMVASATFTPWLAACSAITLTGFALRLAFSE